MTKSLASKFASIGLLVGGLLAVSSPSAGMRNRSITDKGDIIPGCGGSEQQIATREIKVTDGPSLGLFSTSRHVAPVNSGLTPYAEARGRLVSTARSRVSRAVTT